MQYSVIHIHTSFAEEWQKDLFDQQLCDLGIDTIDGEDYYLDLLFYHRKLHRLIAIDLKLGSFKAQYKGQMELYLRWLEKYEMQPGEETPLGLLLCTEGSDEQISLLQLDKSGIRVAQYLTELPSKEVLLRQLQKSIEAARENMPIENEKQ